MKITKKQLTRHSLYILKNMSYSFTNYILNKSENKLLAVPVAGVVAYARDSFTSWIDRKAADLGRIPCVYTSEFAPIKSFIEEITSKDLPYTNLTVLLYGNPGTGKSFFVSMAAAFHSAQSCDLAPQLRFGSSSRKDRNGYEVGGRSSSPARLSSDGTLTVYYLNEIDRYCTAQQADPVLEASLLDVLDKPKRSLNEKSITILTTNYLEQIPDVLKRPGRIDLIIEVQGMNEDECKKMMKLYNFNGPMPPKNVYDKYSPGEVYDHMRRNTIK